MEIAARIRSFEISPVRFVQVAWTNVFLLWLIVGTGAAVRLTDSGLGCSHWPGCERGAPLPEKNVHAFVEFGNRLVGGVVITARSSTWLAARNTPGLPVGSRRLALAVLLGALAQAPLGYLAVASDLRWPVVMTHLLLSIALLAGAVVIAVEAVGLRDGRLGADRAHSSSGAWRSCSRRPASRSSSAAPSRPPPARTPAGARTSSRFGSLQPTVYVHGVFVGFFLISFLLSIGYLAAYRDRSPKLFRFALLTLALLIVQMGVGELQWRTKLPWELVLVHVALAAAVWACTVALAALFFRPPRSLLAGNT